MNSMEGSPHGPLRVPHHNTHRLAKGNTKNFRRNEAWRADLGMAIPMARNAEVAKDGLAGQMNHAATTSITTTTATATCCC